MQNTHEYNSPVASIKWDERGFFKFKLKSESAIYDKNEVINQYNYLMKETKGSSYKLLMDATDSLVFPTDDAFEYFFDKNSGRTTIAIIVTSLPMQILMGQMLKSSGITNAKLFKSESEAIQWITQFK